MSPREGSRQNRCAAGPATVGTYAQGLPDWIDLTPTIAFEDWPKGNEPVSVAYFVGTVPEPTGDRDIERETEQVGNLARQWLKQHAHILWPNAGRRGDFDWRVLHDIADGLRLLRDITEAAPEMQLIQAELLIKKTSQCAWNLISMAARLRTPMS